LEQISFHRNKGKNIFHNKLEKSFAE